MSNYANQELTREASEKGVLIGKTEPCRETKFSWWEVFFYNEKIIACVCWETGISGGEEITEDELNLFVDEPIAAKEKIKKARNNEK